VVGVVDDEPEPPDPPVVVFTLVSWTTSCVGETVGTSHAMSTKATRRAASGP
jgi:hypothetical protein